ncbi:MAG: hypothetical protein GF418_04920 [Chitinivibrionales bacterium]|nr:hypothetical protein [Chitinivibrionales bacterium]
MKTLTNKALDCISCAPAALVALALTCYLPFMHKPVHIDGTMMVHTSRQMLVDVWNPPLGEFGKHLVLHDRTRMPEQSVFFRTGHPPLVPLLMAPATALARDGEWPFHAFMLGFYLALVLGGWHLFGLFYAGNNRIAGALLLTTCPAIVVNSHNIMWDIPITALMTWTFVLFIRALRTRRPGLYFASGVMTGIAALSKSNAIALYVLFGLYLVWRRRGKALILWGVPAVVLPGLWVIHNVFVFGEIQYLSVGWFSFLPGDIRYRFERTISYLGGCVLVPPFLYWALLRTRKAFLGFVPVLVLAAAWGGLLVGVLARPLWFGVTYAMLASIGLLFLYMLVRTDQHRIACYRSRDERILVAGFAVLYLLVLMIHPSSQVRYALPLYPFLVIVVVDAASQLAGQQKRWFWPLCLCAGTGFSLLLSVGDYLLCDGARRLPGKLDEKGYAPRHTWYYGRLAFGYYLYRAGFRNILTDPGVPEPGDYAVDEYLPRDYPVREILPRRFSLEEIDTIAFYQWALRTKGRYAGFYGNSRIPYALDWASPVRAVKVYRLKSAGPLPSAPADADPAAAETGVRP